MNLFNAAGLMVIVVASLGAAAHADEPPSVAVVVGRDAGDVERFAADELCSYLKKLYSVDASPVTEVPAQTRLLLLVGSPRTNAAVARAVGPNDWPKTSDQGLVLKNATLDGNRAFVIGGGSPVATLWAVYELVERWGVRYLLHGDVLPDVADDISSLRLPERDVVLEPKFPVRQWRVVNDFACGPEAWGIDDYRPVLNQLAKLKFNRIYAVIYPWQPYLDLKFKGIERQQAWLWYDFHYPITDDMPGRALFGALTEWWNPDVPYHASYPDMAAAGRRHLQSVLDHAKSRGMEVAMTVNLTEFPREFAALLKDHRVIYDGLGNLSVTPGPKQPIDDPDLFDLSAAVIQQTVATYPQVDLVVPGLPEIPHWIDGFQQAWAVLDAKYQLEARFPVQKMLEAAGNRHGYAGGLERAVHEVKGNIIATYIIDKLFRERGVMAHSVRPDCRLMFNSMAEEFLPALQSILPPGSETLNLGDYTPDRVAARPRVFEYGKNSTIRHSLIFTLHDDNVGILPMLNTGSLAKLADHMQANGWAGFSTRYWVIGDHDPCVAFIARRAWDGTVTPADIYRDQVEHVCGPEAVDDLLQMFAELEAVTVKLNQQGMGLTFPTGRTVITQHFTTEPLPKHLAEWREHYRRALAAARRASDKTSVGGRPYVAYWMARLQLGEGYFNCAEAARALATARADLRTAEESGDAKQIAAKRQQAIASADAAVQAARDMLEPYAHVARDASDRGTVAVMSEYVYRPLKEIADSLK